MHSVWIQAFAIGENFGKFGGPQRLYQKRRKTPLHEGTLLDLRPPHGKIGIILRCNPWAVGWSPEGTFLAVLYGENMRKSENLATLTPRSSATVRRIEKLTDSETP